MPESPRLPPPHTARTAARFRRSDTARLEAFSDGVFAVAATILVLEIQDPAHHKGGLARALLEQWPSYVGYLASFAYVAVIWLNHHQAFARIRSVDRGLQGANLLLLFTTAALAFPTGVLSDALQESAHGADARTAVLTYALVAAAMCASWLLLYTYLRHHPSLLDPAVEASYVRHGQLRSAAGVAAYTLAGLLGWLATPPVALAVFAALPIFYFATSEGLPRHPRT
ncbi:TMEM175 family protein [Streptomyces sp. NPDC005803]|uniref:TMEM175 family protein n=1 Tax=Streptomyces sp. NPDC005803 TaxID=3154297 RepID=UPI0033C35159